eukprot:TRINITY_DN52534_c0_g1_i1.p1 TRINITY_DN52534_c0_g1~~TRINITY_DN52534_c0_g1_i1.p1  ORF type:complete len:190 (+),score=35.76 TRINITY_DN52534_c0_g1_i1:64-633(+)
MSFLSFLCCTARGEPAVEALPPPENPAVVPEMWPHTVFVTCPRAHFAGTYHIVPGVTPNSLPLWKKEDSDDWLFNGTSGQWFIGDEEERAEGFISNTGNIASFEVAAGRMPDEIGPGGWLFLEDSNWSDDVEINVTSECVTLESQLQQIALAKREMAAATRIQACHRGNNGRRETNRIRIQQQGQEKSR